MRGCVLEVQEENMMSAWCLMVKVEEQSAGRDSCRVQTSLSKTQIYCKKLKILSPIVLIHMRRVTVPLWGGGVRVYQVCGRSWEGNKAEVRRVTNMRVQGKSGADVWQELGRRKVTKPIWGG
jgi:hypothetical protein